MLPSPSATGAISFSGQRYTVSEGSCPEIARAAIQPGPASRSRTCQGGPGVPAVALCLSEASKPGSQPTKGAVMQMAEQKSD
jgi:hypothetical protein